MSKGPVLIELEAEAPDPSLDPARAPDVPDARAASLDRAARFVARPRSGIARMFWAVGMALLMAVVSVMAWDFFWAMLGRMPVLGWAIGALMALFLALGLVMAVREALAILRLRRVDRLQHALASARQTGDSAAARAQIGRLGGLYRGREDLAWGRERLRERLPEALDADAMLSLAEQELMAPLDRMAVAEVEAAARQVATVTALVPLALADVIAALSANLRMIRRIAEIYGGRAGTLGSWRLMRAVMTHLVATGAVAVGDDLIGSLAGGGVLAKLSRRFGEGLVNGALTARVGIAAMEVCRPMAFHDEKRPSVSAVIKRALAGFFAKFDAEEGAEKPQ